MPFTDDSDWLARKVSGIFMLDIYFPVGMKMFFIVPTLIHLHFLEYCLSISLAIWGLFYSEISFGIFFPKKSIHSDFPVNLHRTEQNRFFMLLIPLFL